MRNMLVSVLIKFGVVGARTYIAEIKPWLSDHFAVRQLLGTDYVFAGENIGTFSTF